MLRFIFVITISLPLIIYYMSRIAYVLKHPDKYDELRRYELARQIVRHVKRNGFIRTDASGTENLPREGGYIMYANHQGKYDALGIISSHEDPCTILIDDARADLPITKEFIKLVKGTRLDKTNMKNQMKAILSIAEEVKNGRKYIIFPEGGYDHNHNSVQDFLPGAFKSAVKAKSPIVPVALIDSYKPFELNSLKPVRTQVHYLPPLYFEDYKDMNTQAISQTVRERIIQSIHENCEA